MSQSDPSAHSRPNSPFSGRVVALAVITVAAVATAITLTSMAEAGRWFGRDHPSHGEFDSERAHERAEFAVGWALRRIDASDEQEAQINAIVAGAIDQLVALKQDHGDQHEAFVALLGADSVDRAGLEAMRVQGMGMADNASTVLTQALADIGDVLTPEQRAELIEHAGRHRGGHRWH